MGMQGMLLTGLAVFWSVIYRILSKVESCQNKKQSFVYYLLIVLSLLPLRNVDLLLSGIIIVLCVIALQIKHLTKVNKTGTIQACEEWFIEYNDETIALLIDGQMEDMFWYSYTVEPMNLKWISVLTNNLLWDRFQFRNKTGLYAEHVILSAEHGEEIKLNERVKLRGLIIHN